MPRKAKPAAARRLLSLSEESYDFLFDVILPGPGPKVTADQMESGYSKLRADLREVGPDQRQAAKLHGYKEPAPLVCEGPGPHAGTQSRLVPYSLDGNMILCQHCFNREMRSRCQDNLTKKHRQDWTEIPAWESLKTYNPR